MTLPGASVMEWTVCYGMDSATAKGGLVATDMVYLKLGPEVEDPRGVLKSLLFGLLWLAKRSRINGIAIVLGQALRDRGQVLLLDCVKPHADEFDLWGIEVFWVGHWGGAIEGGLPGDPEAS